MKSHEELIAEGYKAYESEKLTVYWKPSLCTSNPYGDGHVSERIADIIERI